VGEADFDAIDEAIAGAFEEGEEGLVRGAEGSVVLVGVSTAIPMVGYDRILSIQCMVYAARDPIGGRLT
jgi:hypothetical protein